MFVCAVRGGKHLGGTPWEKTGSGGIAPLTEGPTVIEASPARSDARTARGGWFGLWFGDAVRLGLSEDSDSLEVRVPDAFFREWIRNHYSDSLLEVAQAVLGRSIPLSIQIYDEAEPPLEMWSSQHQLPLSPILEPARRQHYYPHCQTLPDAPSTFPRPPSGMPGTSNCHGPFPPQSSGSTASPPANAKRSPTPQFYPPVDRRAGSFGALRILSLALVISWLMLQQERWPARPVVLLTL